MVSEFRHQPHDRKEGGLGGRGRLVSGNLGRKHWRLARLGCGVLGISSHKNKGMMCIE